MGISLAMDGTSTERILALWDFEHSPLFSEAECAALSFAYHAALVPNAVTSQHRARLRQHITPEQCGLIPSVVCMAAWRNTWHDSLATLTDQESVDWAQDHLRGVGWEVGCHVNPTRERAPQGTWHKNAP